MTDSAKTDSPASLGLFEAYGIELEYMIVRDDDLRVLPVCDEILRAVAGEYVGDIEDGPIAWSNELVLHVIELKTNGPSTSLVGCAEDFARDLARIDTILDGMGGRLLGTGMHPFMDPATEKRLWPHDHSAVYEAYDRIHGCGGHGWANLQSMHINLPFRGDDEFGRLHAAIRAVLPILPALAASTPVMDGRITGVRDNRLEVYRTNQRKTPLATGRVVPEPAWTRAEYHERILAPLYRQIAPLDSDGILQEEFLNSRGAIARFDRNAIEIRVLDTQEHPAADLGIALLVTHVVKALCEERWVSLATLQALDTDALADTFLAVVRDAEDASIAHEPLLVALGLPPAAQRAGDVWRTLLERVVPSAPAGMSAPHAAVTTILERGTLAARLLRALGPTPSHAALVDTYRGVARCLRTNRSFDA